VAAVQYLNRSVGIEDILVDWNVLSKFVIDGLYLKTPAGTAVTLAQRKNANLALFARMLYLNIFSGIVPVNPESIKEFSTVDARVAPENTSSETVVSKVHPRNTLTRVVRCFRLFMYLDTDVRLEQP